jgi:hypothetical protein
MVLSVPRRRPEDSITPQVHLTFATDDKVVELAEKGEGLKDLASREALQHGIEMGRGGLFLTLTP